MENSSLLIFWVSISSVLCFRIIYNQSCVNRYELSFLSMSMMGFQK